MSKMLDDVNVQRKGKIRNKKIYIYKLFISDNIPDPRCHYSMLLFVRSNPFSAKS